MLQTFMLSTHVLQALCRWVLWLGCFFLIHAAIAQDVVGPMRWVMPSPDGHVYQVAQSDFNGRLWMLGASGRIRRGFAGDTLQSFTGPTRMNYQAIAFSGSQVIVTGQSGTTGRVSYSTDNGLTWQSGVMTDSATQFFTKVLLASPLEAMAQDANGRWFRSTNGGRNWAALPGGNRTTNAKIYAGFQGLWLLAKGDSLLRSIDHGQTWLPCLGTLGQIAAIQMASASEGICAAADGLFYTMNGGQNWSPFASPDQAPQGVSLAENSVISYGSTGLSIFPRQGGQVIGPVRTLSSWQVIGQHQSTTGFPIQKLWQLTDSLGYIQTANQALGLWRLLPNGQIETQLLQQGQLLPWTSAQIGTVVLPNGHQPQRLFLTRPFGIVNAIESGRDQGNGGLVRLLEPNFRATNPVKTIEEGVWHITAEASGQIFLTHIPSGRDTVISLPSPLAGIKDMIFRPRLDQPMDSLWVLAANGRLACWLLSADLQLFMPLARPANLNFPTYTYSQANGLLALSQMADYPAASEHPWGAERLYLRLGTDSLSALQVGAASFMYPISAVGWHPCGQWFLDSISFFGQTAGRPYGYRVPMEADDSLTGVAAMPRGYGLVSGRMGAIGLFFLTKKGKIFRYATDSTGQSPFQLVTTYPAPLLENDRYSSIFWLVSDDTAGQSQLLALTQLGRGYQLPIRAPLVKLPFRPNQIAQRVDEKAFQVYPNPAQSEVCVQSEAPIQAFRWLDITGKSASAAQPLADPQTVLKVRIPYQQKGFYLLGILTGHGWSFQKVAKE